MAVTAVLLLLLVSGASASHYFGGTMTFSYKGRNPDGTFRVELRNRETFEQCSDSSFYSHYWHCSSGNCGYNSRTQSGELDRSTNAPQSNNQWCESEIVSTRILPSNRPFQMRERNCCWIPTRNTIHWWDLETSVDLGTRSDTGEPNKSPDVAILPFLRVPQNCPRTYNLSSFDPDGDRVRCRYGNFGSAGFHLDQDSCTLHYRSASADPRVFAFELVVEDFPQRPITLAYTDGSSRAALPATSTQAPSTTTPPYITNPLYVTPLSKLPLQFSVLVDPSAPSCQDGQYLPKFVHPTPENAAHIRAEVNKEVEIRVRAQAAYATVHDMIISGPLNISKHRTTHDEFVIRWTPTAEDLGDHFPVCFAVEAVTQSAATTSPPYIYPYFHNHGSPSSQSGIYQSDMRCVVVDVKPRQFEANVICGESTMRVEVEKSSLSGLHEDHLRLSDPSNTACSLQRYSNSTHVIAVVPLNACGTQIEEDNESLIFKNEITTVDNGRDLITRKHLVEVQFKCQYSKQGNVSLGFTAHRENITVWEKGLGTFTYQFEFYPDNQFRTMIDPSSYPLEYDVGSRIYMEIEATSQLNTTELFVESCRAAPYDNPNYWPTYSIIENGCTVDSTVQIHSSHQKQFKFSMEAFKFIGLHDQVYISCSVLMCEAGAPGTRCSQGCINSTRSGGHRHQHHHRKREVVTQTARHLISQGPLRLRRSAERTESPAVNVNLNLVFIAGCLLAAVGMICGVVVYKTRVSRVKYQPLPVFES
ncbi:uncharacterized protein [Pempheris klunzingeri]|uniref:uncharacterized protein n=1 Tax=Pempheris klunzingeri TaxID=3127111 RepID=UPI00397F9C32